MLSRIFNERCLRPPTMRHILARMSPNGALTQIPLLVHSAFCRARNSAASRRTQSRSSTRRLRLVRNHAVAPAVESALGPAMDDASVAPLRIAARLHLPSPCHTFCARLRSTWFTKVRGAREDAPVFTREKIARNNSGRCQLFVSSPSASARSRQYTNSNSAASLTVRTFTAFTRQHNRAPSGFESLYLLCIVYYDPRHRRRTVQLRALDPRAHGRVLLSLRHTGNG
eukprot:6189141-Pleurochrysis_carterae.AAC.3